MPGGGGPPIILTWITEILEQLEVAFPSHQGRNKRELGSGRLSVRRGPDIQHALQCRRRALRRQQGVGLDGQTLARASATVISRSTRPGALVSETWSSDQTRVDSLAPAPGELNGIPFIAPNSINNYHR